MVQGKLYLSTPVAYSVAVVVLATTLSGGCRAFMQGYNEGYSGSSPASNYEDYSDVSVDVSPDGKRLAFVGKGAGDNRDLYLLDLQSHDVIPVAKTNQQEADPAFSNDGNSLLYAASDYATNGDSIYQRHLDRKALKRLTSTPDRTDAFPRFSPDGSHIVFARGHHYGIDDEGDMVWSQWDIYMMRKDGSQLKRITRANYSSISFPRFSADGKTIYYSGNLDPNNVLWKVYSIKLGRGQKPQVVTDAGRGKPQYYSVGSDPDLSPDKKRLVFISDRSKRYEYELYVTGLNGTGAKRITWHRAYINKPVWAKDGRHVYYLLDRENNDYYELWRTDANGKNARRIADQGLFTQPMRWRKK